MATPSVILDPIRGDDGAEQLLINVKSFVRGLLPGGLGSLWGVFILYRGLGFFELSPAVVHTVLWRGAKLFIMSVCKMLYNGRSRLHFFFFVLLNFNATL